MKYVAIVVNECIINEVCLLLLLMSVSYIKYVCYCY